MPTTKTKAVAKKTVLDIMAARHFMYSLLKRAFIEEPNKEFITMLSDGDMLKNIPFADENELIREGSEDIFLFTQDPELFKDNNMDELAADYAMLYLGPGSLKAPPYESVHLSDKPLVFQDETIEVRKEYIREELLPEKYNLEPDDHMSLELDFMAYLTKKATKELRADNYKKAKATFKKQKGFLADHLSLWSPMFADKTIKHATMDYYRGMGKMLKGFVSYDVRTVDALIGDCEVRIKKQKEAAKKSH